MYIIGFNGPPECGKNTLANIVSAVICQRSQIPLRFESLAMPLRHIAYSMASWPAAVFDEMAYATFKNTRFPLLGNNSGRQLMIDASEKFLKPVYGIDIMARLLLQRNRKFPGILLVTDSGFQCEVDPLDEAVGPGKLLIVNIHRKGKTFDGDSREWVTHSNSLTVHNNATIEDLTVDANRLVDHIVAKGWQL